MASPVLQTTAVTNISTAADPWVVNLPASIANGDLLLYFCRVAGNVSQTNPAGTNLIRQSLDDASDDIQNVYGRISGGGEPSTENVDMGSTVKGACIVARISGSETSGTWGTSGTIVQCAVANTNIGTTANANPAAITPSGGSKDYLICTFLGMDHETATFTSPSTYSTAVTANSGTGGAVATNCMIAIAFKAITGTTEDPGAWTSTAASSGWCNMTMAIYPGTFVPPTTLPRDKPSSRAAHRFLTVR